jgi:hypothetical protein
MHALIVVCAFLTTQIAPRHRAARPPSASCTLPTLVITLSKPAACKTDTVTLSWHASDANAIVSIVGVGLSLPADGAEPIDSSTPMTYSGSARNACGAGTTAIAEYKVLPDGTASLDPGATTIQQGQTTPLTVSVVDVIGWTLSSALGNGLSATAGKTSSTVIYTGTHAGSDTVTLHAAGNCGPLTSFASIFVSPPPPPPPPPSSGFLRCCDGSLSPTCTSCANKQGCCSHHGGVCGCS